MKAINFTFAILISASQLYSQTFDWAYTHINQNWNHNLPADMCTDNSGNVYITGKKFGNTSDDYFTHKISPDGTLLWAVTYNGNLNSSDVSNAVAVDNSGNVYVTGAAFDTAANSTDITTIKYNSAGNIIWVRSFNGPGSYQDEGKKIAVDNSGNIIVAGTSYGTGTATDYVILKYTSSGNLLYHKRYNGTANSYDELADMKLDISGDIIVTGTSNGTGTGQDYATVRFSGSTGNIVWEARYNNPETVGNPDVVSALAIGNNGDIYVTGRSYSQAGGWDFLTQKYSASTGSQLWTKRYNGSQNGWDWPMAISADEFGNVYLSGFSYENGFSGSVIAVIKYDQSGNTSWSRFHNINSGATESAVSLALDNTGNPYVTVFSNGEGYFINLKYSAAAGNTLWQHTYNSGGYTEPKKIIVDDNGSIYVTGQNGTRTTTLKYSQQMTGLESNSITPEDYMLEQNYPNPFNPSTTIRFKIRQSSHVKLNVFDVTGMLVKELVNGTVNSGTHEMKFEASGLASGTYFYRLETEGYSDVKKMILVK